MAARTRNGNDRPFWIVNPDLLTRDIAHAEQLALRDANLAAVQRVEAWLEATMAVHKPLGVETVLSTPKYRRLVDRAHDLGFEVRLVYVVLESADLNVERVRLRVLKGGHGVAEEDIRRRYDRSLAQLPWFLEHADLAVLYDNSGTEPRLVGLKERGSTQLLPDAPVVLRRALSIPDQA